MNSKQPKENKMSIENNNLESLEDASLEDLEKKFGQAMQLIEKKRQEKKKEAQRQKKKIYDQERKKTTFALNSRFNSHQDVELLHDIVKKARNQAKSHQSTLATELRNFLDFDLSAVVTTPDAAEAVKNLLEKAQKLAIINGWSLADEINIIATELPKGPRRNRRRNRSATEGKTSASANTPASNTASTTTGQSDQN